MQDTDVISIVLTVKTAKTLLSALSSKVMLDQDAALAVERSIVASLGPPEPLPPFPDPTQ